MSLLSQIGSLLGSASSTSTNAAMAAAANAKPFSQTLQQSIDLQNSAAAQSASKPPASSFSPSRRPLRRPRQLRRACMTRRRRRSFDEEPGCREQQHGQQQLDERFLIQFVVGLVVHFVCQYAAGLDRQDQHDAGEIRQHDHADRRGHGSSGCGCPGTGSSAGQRE